ncbi:hypothetical protein LCGC14_1624050 [marine sediment metagenome]|uniref:Uncharacterized protein n=1 Tax=marine sediment metagenome TaxID=412755 RepID=A0A0F9I4L7_9ZZZZ
MIPLRYWFAAPVAVFALGAAFFWFQNVLIEAKPLDEIKITIQHRPTPPIVVIRLRQCKRKFPHNGWQRAKCINEALGI